MAIADYQRILAQFNAAPAMRRTRQVGQGESSYLEDYDDPASRMVDGREYTLDARTGQLRYATGDMQSGGITTTLLNADGTTSSSFEARRSMGDKWADAARTALPYLAAMATIAYGGTSLLAGGGAGASGAGAGIAGGADLAAAYGAGAGGAAAGAGGAAAGASALLTPTNAMLAGTLLSGAMSMQQGRQQADAISAATAANERIAADQAAEAERVRLQGEREREAARNAAGSMPGRSPSATAGARARNRAGASSTMLTGPGGVNTGSLALSSPTLLGRLA